MTNLDVVLLVTGLVVCASAPAVFARAGGRGLVWLSAGAALLGSAARLAVRGMAPLSDAPRDFWWSAAVLAAGSAAVAVRTRSHDTLSPLGFARNVLLFIAGAAVALGVLVGGTVLLLSNAFG